MAGRYLLATYFGRKRLSTLPLDLDAKGMRLLLDGEGEGHAHAVARFESSERGCVLKPAGNRRLCDRDGQDIEEADLSAFKGQVALTVQGGSEASDDSAVVMRPSTRGIRSHTAYVPSAAFDVVVGSAKGSGIAYGSPLVSGDHARLAFDGSSYTVEDLSSRLGTYVNDVRIGPGSPCRLSSGDAVTVLDLTFMPVGKTLIMNAPEGVVIADLMASGRLVRIEHAELVRRAPQATPDDKLPDPRPFWPAPRLMHTVHAKSLKVEGPPPAKEPDDTPMMMRMGPSFLMGFASVFMAASAFSRLSGGGDVPSTLPTIAMSISMVAGMVIWPFISRNYDRKHAAALERKRRSAYADYIGGVEAALRAERDEQTKILEENRVDAHECLHRAETRSPSLMGRSPEEPDFLNVRIGTGNQDLEANIRWPEASSSLEQDDLLDMAVRLSKNPPQLENVPIALDLSKNNILGIVGDYDGRWDLVRSMVVQVSALWSYDDVRLALIASPEDEREWRFVRELPHSLAPDGRMRLIASDEQGVREVGGLLGKVLSQRKPKDDGSEHAPTLPHYLVVCADRDLADGSDAVSRIMEADGDAGFSLVFLSGTVEGLPKECAEVIELAREGGSRAYSRVDVSSQVGFVPDERLSLHEAGSFAHSLARVDLGGKDSSFVLPRSLGFLASYSVGNTSDLDIASRWASADSSRSLAAPLGVDSRGSIATLDPHESFDGPHGLVAGTTGSGKSELLITWILSTAVCFPPEQAAFVLIDYKGGGLADAFSRPGMELPHLAGTVTNLDGGEVQRSLASLQAELIRRQRMLADAKGLTGDATMDVASYQRHWAAGDVEEPMPHLFVVADEFAELKQQEPEFMDGLISAARIGRSLGVHLVLATQKPTGVVNDQISANSRFRVCLKVADAADSKEMIRRPDAAGLEGPGRLILLVGYDERLCLGQAAWCGGPYVPSSEPQAFRDNSVELCDDMGAAELSARPKEKRASEGTELDAVLLEIRRQASGRAARKLWLPPLEKHTTVDGLRERYPDARANDAHWELDPLVGELDDPANQAKRLLTLPLSREGNAVVYGAVGSGAEGALQTMVYDLLLDHDASELNAYIMDLGSGGLMSFEKAPQMGGVVRGSDEDGVRRLLDMLCTFIAKRRDTLAPYGGSMARLHEAGRTMPSVLLVISNMAAFWELYPDEEQRIVQIARDGVSVGMHMVVLAPTASSMKFRLRSNFRLAIASELQSRDEFLAAFGSLHGVKVPSGRGRGLVQQEDSLLVYQTAEVTAERSPYEACETLATSLAADAKLLAPAIPSLPKVVPMSMLVQAAGATRIPCGLFVDDLTGAFFEPGDGCVKRILYQRSVQCKNFLATWVAALVASGWDVAVVDAGGLLPSAKPEEELSPSDKDEEARVSLLHALALADEPTSRTRLLVVTGFAGLVSRLGSTKSLELTDAIKRLNPAGSLLVVIVDMADSAGSYCRQPWFREQGSTRDALWVGDGIASQGSLPLNYVAHLEPKVGGSMGYLVEGGTPRLVKLVGR